MALNMFFLKKTYGGQMYAESFTCWRRHCAKASNPSAFCATASD
jgi:hypothetical protein